MTQFSYNYNPGTLNEGTAIVPTSGGNGTAIVPTSGGAGVAIVASTGGDGTQTRVSQGGTEYALGDLVIKNVSISFNRTTMAVTAECDLLGVDYDDPDDKYFLDIFTNELYNQGETGIARVRKVINQSDLTPAAEKGSWEGWVHHSVIWECGTPAQFSGNPYRFQDHGIHEMRLKITNVGPGGSVTFSQDVDFNMDPIEQYLELRSPTSNYVSYGAYGPCYPYFEFKIKNLPASARMLTTFTNDDNGTLFGVSSNLSVNGVEIGYSVLNKKVWYYFDDGTNHTDHTTDTDAVQGPYLLDGLPIGEIPQDVKLDITGYFWRPIDYYRLNLNIDQQDIQLSPGDNSIEFNLYMA